MRTSSSLEVNLNCLSSNFDKLKKISKKNIIFMIKANAYGHGLIPIVEHCLRENLCNEFGCASIGEAIELRANIPGDYKVWVFSETEIHDPEYSKHYNQSTIPVIHELSHMEHFLKLKDVPLCIKLNTGMNRLGISFEQLQELIDILKLNQRKSINHLMSHYASSYLPSLKSAKRQKEEFDLIVRELKSSGIEIEESSVANSGAIENNFLFENSHIRPGLMLYGPSSLVDSNTKWSGEVISTLKTQIIHLEKIKKGTPVGYGGHICHQNGVLAIAPIGYGDGILTGYSGVKFPHLEFEALILGRVNMDLIQILLPENAWEKVKVNNELILWNNEQSSILGLVKQMKTIPYQLFCALSSRLPRKYQ